MSVNKNSTVQIVYVDDDPEDRFLFVDAFKQVAPDYGIDTLPDGASALRYLSDHASSLPCLVIVDLNMPNMNGKELIRTLKSNQALQPLSLVAFTTSSSAADRTECAKYGVDMITKPVTFDQLKETMKVLLSYCKTAA